MPPGGSAEAGAAATQVVDDGERAKPGGSAKAGAAATRGLENGESAPPGRSAEAGAAATVKGVATLTAAISWEQCREMQATFTREQMRRASESVRPQTRSLVCRMVCIQDLFLRKGKGEPEKILSNQGKNLDRSPGPLSNTGTISSPLAG